MPTVCGGPAPRTARGANPFGRSLGRVGRAASQSGLAARAPLERTDEADIFRRIRAGDGAAREEMLERNRPLVWALMRQYSHSSIAPDDLVQEGMLGLLRAIDRFDQSKGYKFCTYAVYWIRQGMSRAIVDTGRTIRLPGHVIEKISRINRARTQLESEFGRTPTIDELAEKTELTADQVVAIERALVEPQSLDASVAGSTDLTLVEALASDTVVDPEETVLREAVREAAADALGHLTRRERLILELHHGFRTGKPVSLKLIAERLNLTGERVRQIENRALQKLRGETGANLRRTAIG